MSNEHAKRVFRELQTLARADYGGNTGALLVVYAVEGFLRRLAASPYATQMTLKGGMLMAALGCAQDDQGRRSVNGRCRQRRGARGRCGRRHRRDPLVQQWHESLLRSRHVELHPGGEVERRGQDGVVVTYQSLNLNTVGVHAKQAELQRTLFVLDEVHHVGEPTETGIRPAWARHITELIGDVEKEIHVAGVLNLSGALWRSKRSERISTVRYAQDHEQKLVSDVDFEITAVELIRDGHLRPVDLFRRGATVELVNLSEAQRIVSKIADLDQNAAGRAAIRGLPSDPTWRENFVDAVLERLELRHRDLGNGPAKALIVARSQGDARLFQETADRLMRERGLRPIAELAVSSEMDAHQVLERFRRHQRPGVLCTVDMAGEGYDCPEIAVVGFATNKLTPLYVRQVVARAQRVTVRARENWAPHPGGRDHSRRARAGRGHELHSGTDAPRATRSGRGPR